MFTRKPSITTIASVDCHKRKMTLWCSCSLNA